ncbi:heavy metal-binding domain-containing protein [Acidithiobacillus sp. MC6.1]|nr:heavy metal-binding domain-containing protein [Acidithiobacillus sp. MC6.1]
MTVTLSTTDVPQHVTSYKNLGTLIAVNVRSRSQMGNFFSRIRAMAGGRIAAYEGMVRKAREDVMQELAQKAEDMGATHVYSMRFDTSSISIGKDEDFLEISVYGTAIQMPETK